MQKTIQYIDVVFDDDSWQINPLMACLSGPVTDVEGDGADYLLQAGESVESEAFVRELAQCVPQHGDALIPAQHVKAFVRSQKNDASDALAIGETACRPSIHFVWSQPRNSRISKRCGIPVN